MSDIILISPPGSTAERLYSMSEAGQLYAVFQQNGYDVKLFDGIRYGLNADYLAHSIEQERPKLVCLVLQWEHQPFQHWIAQLLTAIQEIKLNTHITAVGRGSTLCYRPILERYPVINSIIRGETEKTAVELMIKICHSQSWHSQKGIAFKNEESISINPAQEPLLDLDRLPFAYRDYLKDYRPASRHSLGMIPHDLLRQMFE